MRQNLNQKIVLTSDLVSAFNWVLQNCFLIFSVILVLEMTESQTP